MLALSKSKFKGNQNITVAHQPSEELEGQGLRSVDLSPGWHLLPKCVAGKDMLGNWAMACGTKWKFLELYSPNIIFTQDSKPKAIPHITGRIMEIRTTIKDLKDSGWFILIPSPLNSTTYCMQKKKKKKGLENFWISKILSDCDIKCPCCS